MNESDRDVRRVLIAGLILASVFAGYVWGAVWWLS